MFCSLISLFAAGQSVEKEVARIRQQYNEAQSVAKYMNTDEWMENDCHSLSLNSSICYAGGGIMKHDTQVLLTRVEGSNEDTEAFNSFRPWLTIESLGGGFVVYREMLFDRITGKLIFCYQHTVLPDESVCEQRFYFKNGKLIKSVPADEESLCLTMPDKILSIAEAMKTMISSYNSVDEL